MVRKESSLFTKDQLKRTSSIFDNAGQVVLTTIILPPFVSSVASVDLSVIVLGVGSCLVCWWLALRLERISS